jgi:hypothetical protein
MVTEQNRNKTYHRRQQEIEWRLESPTPRQAKDIPVLIIDLDGD